MGQNERSPLEWESIRVEGDGHKRWNRVQQTKSESSTNSMILGDDEVISELPSPLLKPTPNGILGFTSRYLKGLQKTEKGFKSFIHSLLSL